MISILLRGARTQRHETVCSPYAEVSLGKELLGSVLLDGRGGGDEGHLGAQGHSWQVVKWRGVRTRNRGPELAKQKPQWIVLVLVLTSSCSRGLIVTVMSGWVCVGLPPSRLHLQRFLSILLEHRNHKFHTSQILR